MLFARLTLPAITALSLLSAPCLAKKTLFWSHIAAIESRDLSSPSSPLHHDHQQPDIFRRSVRRNIPTPPSHSSSVKCTHPVPRVSFYTLTLVEQRAWIQSFQALHTPNKSIFVKGGTFMDDLALVHIGLQEEMHYNACFLVCHSAFLRAFYSLMRISGYKGREAYWDIEHDWQHGMQNAVLWRSFGGDDGRGGPIPNGPFKHLRCGVLPAKQPGHSVYKNHYVTRYFNSDWNRKPMIRGDMYTSHYNASYFSSIMDAPNYTVHAWTHQSIHGEMALFSAVCEPAFWLLHAEIDRYWRSWQTKHNTWFDYEGHRRIRKPDGSTEYKLATLDDQIDFYGLFEKVKVRDVMHPRRGILCYKYDRLLGGGVDNAV